MRIVGALGVAPGGIVRDRRRHCLRADRYALTVRRNDCGHVHLLRARTVVCSHCPAAQHLISGLIVSAGTLAGWFVMVKDNVGRFPGNKLWGEGWGWSWFDAANPAKTTSTDFRTDCLGCHIPAKATDWIYVLGYPGLKK